MKIQTNALGWFCILSTHFIITRHILNITKIYKVHKKYIVSKQREVKIIIKFHLQNDFSYYFRTQDPYVIQDSHIPLVWKIRREKSI